MRLIIGKDVSRMAIATEELIQLGQVLLCCCLGNFFFDTKCIRHAAGYKGVPGPQRHSMICYLY